MQRLINIALVVLKTFKAVKCTIFPMTFETNQPDVNVMEM